MMVVVMAGGKRKLVIIMMMITIMMGVHPFPITSTGDGGAESGSGSDEDATTDATTTITGTTDSNFFIDRDVLIPVVSSIAALLLIIMAIIIIIPTAYLCHQRLCPYLCRSKEFRDKDKRDKARTEQELKEEERVERLVVNYLDRNKASYTYDTSSFKLGYLGCRLQRLWFRIESMEGKPLMLSIAPVSKRCAIVLEKKTIETLDKIFELFKKKDYPEVHLIRKIDYVYSSESQRGYAIIIQDLCSEGSLRDYLHNLKFEDTWTNYSEISESLRITEVKAFGRQILRGLLRLYRRGIVPLGHLHTGNIFVGESQEASGGNQDEHTATDACTDEIAAAEGDAGHKVCRVGGYENMLLGYRTRLYSKLARSNINMRLIDVYLFGHVLYEMALGRTLEAALPTKKERDVTYKPAEPADTEKEMVAVACFSAQSPKCGSTERKIRLSVSDDENRSTIESELTEVLDYIFDSKKNDNPVVAIQEILNMEFFKSSENLNIKTKQNVKSDKVKKLLQKVKAGEPVTQPVVDQPAVEEPEPADHDIETNNTS